MSDPNVLLLMLHGLTNREHSLRLHDLLTQLQVLTGCFHMLSLFLFKSCATTPPNHTRGQHTFTPSSLQEHITTEVQENILFPM